MGLDVVGEASHGKIIAIEGLHRDGLVSSQLGGFAGLVLCSRSCFLLHSDSEEYLVSFRLDILARARRLGRLAIDEACYGIVQNLSMQMEVEVTRQER